MKSPTCLIIGAGPTGLVLALALLQRGIRVRIVDEKEGPSVHSKAFGIHARTMELFAKLGVIAPFLEKAIYANSLIFHYKREQYAFHLEAGYLQDTPYPFVYLLPQSETERILIDAITKMGGRIEWNTKLLSLENGQALFSTNERVAFDWLIGCDGGKSSVRHQLHLPFEGIEYPETFLIVDVEGKIRPTSSLLHFFFSKAGLVGIISLNQTQNRLIFPLKENEKLDESITTIQSALEKRGCTHFLSLEKIHWFSYFKIHRRMTATLRKENCFLAGDAAHIHSPAGGQGMNTGIQDAFNLAWKIAQVIQGISPPHLLNTYENERLPVAKKVLKYTTLFTKFLIFIEKTGLFPLFFSALFIVKKFFERKMIRGLTELSISYKKNRSDCFWSGPKSGERAPNVMLENGKNFFDYLNTTHSVLLLFQERDLKHNGFETLVLKDPHLMKAYHATKDSLYFIRPDGVIGYRSRSFNKKNLNNYLLTLFNDSLI